jgi:hypothetical protein
MCLLIGLVCAHLYVRVNQWERESVGVCVYTCVCSCATTATNLFSVLLFCTVITVALVILMKICRYHHKDRIGSSFFWDSNSSEVGSLQLTDVGFTFQTYGFSFVFIGAMQVNIAAKQLCITICLRETNWTWAVWVTSSCHAVHLIARLMVFVLKVMFVTKRRIECSSEQQHVKLEWFCQLFITARTVRWPCLTLVNTCSVKVMFVCWMPCVWNK